MAELSIKVESLSKKYSLLHKSVSADDSIIESANRLAKRMLKPGMNKKRKEDFWALKEVSFEINKGDRVGIIGRNGAGKSTLLKILSRIVSPTSGRVEFYGRMASLLEVGTGFHGDLSGRENIYLNGAILGMNKSEIKKKFDEIVAFSEVEKFLDTPVKRYSSGMYVRLAFAVAAHMEPDILVVDEVLAVGDAAFQKKCIGKMEDVSNKEGRTILFVSHSMSSIQKLCTKGILLQKGELVHKGEIQETIKEYLKFGHSGSVSVFTFEQNNEMSSDILFSQVRLKNEKNELCADFASGENWKIELEFQSLKANEDIVVGFGILTALGTSVLTTWTSPERLKEGVNSVSFEVRNLALCPGYYKVAIGISKGNLVFDYNDTEVFFSINEVLSIPEASRVINTKSGILINQFPYQIN